jgi:hypothetical protein
MSDRRRQGMAAYSGVVEVVTDRVKDKERRRRFSWTEGPWKGERLQRNTSSKDRRKHGRISMSKSDTLA